jgi:arginase family enzyme
MEWQEYFNPISNHIVAEDFNRSQLSSNIDYYGIDKDFPELEEGKYDMVLIGVGYDSTDLAADSRKTPDHVRYWLYRLFKGNYEVRIADTGNLNIKNSLDDVVHHLSDFIAEMIAKKIIPVIIGGGKELTYANYMAYKKSGRYCNLVNISSRLNFEDASEDLTPYNYLSKILADQDNHLFNYSNIGYQTYFTPPELIELFRNFNFDLHRLGEVRAQIEETEPIIRDADFACFDLGAVKYADAPNCTFGTPNGLFGDEICRLARYAGLSMKMSSAGFYGIHPGGKLEWTDHHLMAQCIWHFIEGYYLRKPESMDTEDVQYLRFHVAMQGYPEELTFYKNKVTEKWWMGVPVAEKYKDKYHIREYLVPCSGLDYQVASQNEIPDRWIRVYKKLND